jgi:putative ABC transport system ATP-binding protein
MRPTTAIVAVVDVGKAYRLGRATVGALRQVVLEVEPGQLVALCGPSGSGKTTLLNIMGGLDRPTTGRVLLMNHDVRRLSDARLADLRNRLIGFVFQTVNLVPVLTAYENVEFPLRIQGMGRRDRAHRVHAMLGRMGLETHARHRPDELSGGQRQRVAVARALVTAPKLVLADEPTANLDSETGRAVLGLMRQMNRDYGVTVVFSTHDREVVHYADRVISLRDGLAAEETVEVRG